MTNVGELLIYFIFVVLIIIFQFLRILARILSSDYFKAIFRPLFKNNTRLETTASITKNIPRTSGHELRENNDLFLSAPSKDSSQSREKEIKASSHSISRHPENEISSIKIILRPKIASNILGCKSSDRSDQVVRASSMTFASTNPPHLSIKNLSTGTIPILNSTSPLKSSLKKSSPPATPQRKKSVDFCEGTEFRDAWDTFLLQQEKIPFRVEDYSCSNSTSGEDVQSLEYNSTWRRVVKLIDNAMQSTNDERDIDVLIPPFKYACKAVDLGWVCSVQLAAGTINLSIRASAAVGKGTANLMFTSLCGTLLYLDKKCKKN